MRRRRKRRRRKRKRRAERRDAPLHVEPLHVAPLHVSLSRNRRTLEQEGAKRKNAPLQEAPLHVLRPGSRRTLHQQRLDKRDSALRHRERIEKIKQNYYKTPTFKNQQNENINMSKTTTTDCQLSAFKNRVNTTLATTKQIFIFYSKILSKEWHPTRIHLY